VGRDLAAWWAEAVPEVIVVYDTTAGSVDNLDRLISGEADLAVVGSSPFREVLDGWGTLSDEAHTICVVGTLYMDAEQYVVRSSLVRVGNLLDLNGLIMYPGPYQSGGEIDTRRILTRLEIKPQYIYVDDRDKGYAAAAQALARGDFDAATFSGGVPIQAVTDLFQRYPGEFRILPFSRHMLNKLIHFEGDYEGVVIRAGSYPGQTEDIRTVGGPNLLVASPTVDHEIIAALDLAIRRGIQEKGKGLRSPQNHPVLQALDEALWSLDPVGARCADGGMAKLSGAPEGEENRPH
jgi:TRAP transporter TAXI family solute receptor